MRPGRRALVAKTWGHLLVTQLGESQSACSLTVIPAKAGIHAEDESVSAGVKKAYWVCGFPPSRE